MGGIRVRKTGHELAAGPPSAGVRVVCFVCGNGNLAQTFSLNHPLAHALLYLAMRWKCFRQRVSEPGTMKHKILVVDDDAISLTQTQILLEDHSYSVETAASGEEALKQFGSDPERFTLVVLDHQMKGMSGPETAKALLSLNPDTYILMYSLDKTREALKDALRSGAIDFIDKGADVALFLETVKAWCRKFEDTNQTITADRTLNRDEQLLATVGMAGRSSLLIEMIKKVGKYRQSGEDILILGETGTGKEIVARSLHTGEDSSFFVINCAKYTDNTSLLESELFGHEKGAFTGAMNTKEGLLEKVSHGTIFFDEMHHLSKQAQAKLLRALGYKKGMRVGGYKEYPIKCKFVFSAKPDLCERVEKGEVLEDFFYRLERFVIEVAPLRDRPEDVEPLVSHFIKKFYARHPQEASKKILVRTVKYFERYSWPGNVRELQNTVEQLLTDVSERIISPQHLPSKFFQEEETKVAGNNQTAFATYEELKKSLEAQEKEHITRVLRRSVSQRHAAKKLGIPTSTMNSLLKRLGIGNVK